MPDIFVLVIWQLETVMFSKPPMDSVPSLIALVRVESLQLEATMSRLGLFVLVALMTSASSPLFTSQSRTRMFSLESMLMPSLLCIPRSRLRIVTPSITAPLVWKKFNVHAPGLARWMSRTVTLLQRTQRSRNGRMA